MRYENMNTTLRRAPGGTKAAAIGKVPSAGRDAVNEGAAGTVDGRTFMAAAVMLAIEAFLSKKEAGAASPLCLPCLLGLMLLVVHVVLMALGLGGAFVR